MCDLEGTLLADTKTAFTDIITQELSKEALKRHDKGTVCSLLFANEIVLTLGKGWLLSFGPLPSKIFQARSG